MNTPLKRDVPLNAETRSGFKVLSIGLEVKYRGFRSEFVVVSPFEKPVQGKGTFFLKEVTLIRVRGIADITGHQLQRFRKGIPEMGKEVSGLILASRKTGRPYLDFKGGKIFEHHPEIREVPLRPFIFPVVLEIWLKRSPTFKRARLILKTGSLLSRSSSVRSF